jgi:tetratricopeptide (TPR) repeat protein
MRWMGLGAAAGCALALIALVGCRLPIGRGRFSKSIIQSRQLTQQGLAALEHKNPHEAERLLARAVATCDHDAEARRAYARVLWQNGSRQEALLQLHEAMRLSPDNQAIYRELAEYELALRNHAAAMKLADEAIELDPHAAANWSARAKVHRQNGNPQDALADFQRSLGLEPNQPEVLMEVAQLYRQLNQPARALATLQTLRESYAPDEEPAHVYYLMGQASLALGRTEDAVASFQAARARGDNSAELLYELAAAQLRAGAALDAEQTTTELLARLPTHSAGRALLEQIRTGRVAAPARQLR